jgi:hypothetical protein
MSIRISNSFTPEEVEILAQFGHATLRDRGLIAAKNPVTINLAQKLIRMKIKLMEKTNREEKDGTRTE